MHGQRGCFGTYKGTEVSFWCIKRGRDVVLVQDISEGSFWYIEHVYSIARFKHKVAKYEEQDKIGLVLE